MNLTRNPPIVPQPLIAHTAGDWNDMALSIIPDAKRRGAKYLLQLIDSQGRLMEQREFHTESGVEGTIATLDRATLWRAIEVRKARLIGWQTMLAKPGAPRIVSLPV